MSLDAWMNEGKYLPDVLRDFHDQKDDVKAATEKRNAHDAGLLVAFMTSGRASIEGVGKDG